MELFFEYLLIVTLVSGLLYFLLDFEDVFWKLLGIAANAAMLIGIGFLFGIGIHWANAVFGW